MKIIFKINNSYHKKVIKITKKKNYYIKKINYELI